MNKAPIVISGFGRSGTTWLSDILSKVIGGLILFEPFHPAVFQNAKEVCYSGDKEYFDNIIAHTRLSFLDPPKNPWLLRNHLKEPIEQTSTSFIDYIWKNSEVIGFKSIRCNHILKLFQSRLNARVTYIHRHPLAVLCSILNRKNFWNEFGWEWHCRYFFERTIQKEYFEKEAIELLIDIKENAERKEELILLMWGISFIISLEQVKSASGYLLSYESLYLDPYLEIRKLLKFLNLEKSEIHPSHLFTPSLTTLNTVHYQYESSELTRKGLDDLFWARDLDKNMAEHLVRLLSRILEIDPEAYELALSNGYLQRSYEKPGI